MNEYLQRTFTSCQKGQSVVEYVMLLAVVVFLASLVLKSPIVKGYLGANGKAINFFKDYMEKGYAYGFPYSPNYNYEHDESTGLNPNYYNQSKGESRFFVPQESYPK